MERLTDIGFRKVGKWRLRDGQIVLDLEEEWADATNTLYAFVSGEEVLYVGKTTQTLKKRLCGYVRPGPTQSTNIKGNKSIMELLASGAEIDILALPDNGLLHFGVFHLNLAAGLEDSIVATLRPRWNETGTADKTLQTTG